MAQRSEVNQGARLSWQQQPGSLPMSFPVSYPNMDAQQMQQLYIAQMQQPQPPIGPNVYSQPWYMYQQPTCQGYGYPYGVQMPTDVQMPPQIFNPPPNAASMQTTGTESCIGTGRETGPPLPPTASRRCVQIQSPENSHSRPPGGGKTYKQCSVPLPETACGRCGSVNNFTMDGGPQLQCQRFAARSIYPAPSPQGIQGCQQPLKEEEPQNYSKREQKKQKKIRKDHRIDSEEEEQKIYSENHSRNDSKKEQRKDLEKKHRTEDIQPVILEDDIDSALGRAASSFIKRLGELMRHRYSRKRKQLKGGQQPSPSITPDSSIISSGALEQPPRKRGYLKRLFGEVRDNDVAFYAQKSRSKTHSATNLYSDSAEQLEAFKQMRKKQNWRPIERYPY